MSFCDVPPRGTRPPAFIGSGSQVVGSGTYILDEEGNRILNEEGVPLLEEGTEGRAVATPLSATSVSCQYVIVSFKVTDDTVGDQLLDEDGNPILGEDGDPILTEESDDVSTSSSIGDGEQDFSVGNILAEDGTVILGEDGTGIAEETAGGAVALSDQSILCSKLTIYPKSTNSGTIWIGGPQVEVGRGAPLTTSSQPLVLENVNLTEVYIVGSASGGVTFIYVQAELTETDAGETIWVGGPDVEEGEGTPLTATSAPLKIECSDLSAVYIYGTVGQGVTYTYGADQAPTDDEEPETEPNTLLNTDGNILLNTDGHTLENTDE